MVSWGVDVVQVRDFVQTVEARLSEVGVRGEGTCVAVQLSG
jgi:hypothetical protein